MAKYNVKEIYLKDPRELIVGGKQTDGSSTMGNHIVYQRREKVWKSKSGKEEEKECILWVDGGKSIS